MEHSIRVDDDVFGALKQRAEAFVDTPNSVLRRVLGLDSDSNGSGVRADRPKPPGDSPTRQALAQPAYEVPLLKAIADLGGKARRAEVLRELEKQMGHRFGPEDLAPIRSGAIRWTKTSSWAIKSMKFRGLVDAQAAHGFWVLTQAGRDYLNAETRKAKG